MENSSIFDTIITLLKVSNLLLDNTTYKNEYKRTLQSRTILKREIYDLGYHKCIYIPCTNGNLFIVRDKDMNEKILDISRGETPRGETLNILYDFMNRQKIKRNLKNLVKQENSHIISYDIYTIIELLKK